MLYLKSKKIFLYLLGFFYILGALSSCSKVEFSHQGPLDSKKAKSSSFNPQIFSISNLGSFNNTGLVGQNLLIASDANMGLSYNDLKTRFNLPDPIAYFDMEGINGFQINTGDVLTESISGNDCVVTNTDNNGSMYSANAIVGTSFFLDGTDTHCDTPFLLNPSSQDYTVIGWVQPHDLSESNYMLQQLGANGRTHFEIYNDQMGTYVGGTDTRSDFLPGDSRWYHMAVKLEGTTLKLFVDGIMIKSKTITVESATGGYRIGDDKFLGTYFQGYIDELVFFDEALPDETINLIYQFQKPKSNGEYTSNIIDGGASKNLISLSYITDQSYNTNINSSDEESYSSGLDLTGLIGLYHFETSGWNGTNSEIIDSSTKNNHGTLQGGTVDSNNFGKHNRSAFFSDNNSCLILDTVSSDYNITEGTIELWFYFNKDNFDTYTYLFSFGDYTGGANNGFAAHIDPNGIVSVGFKGYDLTNRYDSASGIVKVKQWHHLVFSFKSSVIKLYIDGDSIPLSPNAANINYGASEKITIGRRILTDSTSPFRGFIDELSIYNRTMTQDEVLLRYKRFFGQVLHQVKVCLNSLCNDANNKFVGPDGTQTSFFNTKASLVNGLIYNDLSSLPSGINGQFFQFKTYLFSDDRDTVNPSINSLEFKISP